MIDCWTKWSTKISNEFHPNGNMFSCFSTQSCYYCYCFKYDVVFHIKFQHLASISIHLQGEENFFLITSAGVFYCDADVIVNPSLTFSLPLSPCENRCMWCTLRIKDDIRNISESFPFQQPIHGWISWFWKTIEKILFNNNDDEEEEGEFFIDKNCIALS